MPRAPRTAADRGLDDYLRSLESLHEQLDAGLSFSGRERNRLFLNCAAGPAEGGASGGRFANASAVSGLDFADDARGLALFDHDHDGDLDLVISNRTAPHLRLMRNATPAAGRSIAVRLEGDGKVTNRDAVGARLVVETSDGVVLRTVKAGDGFLSQSSRWLHVGLGRSQMTDGAARVSWPGGGVETFVGLEPGGRYDLRQGSGSAGRAGRTLPTGRRSGRVALEAAVQRANEVSTGARVVLPARPPAPSLTLAELGAAEARSIEPTPGKPLLVNVWASWCIPCRRELQEIAEGESALRGAGLDVVALSTDGLGESPATSAEDGQRFMDEIEFPFPHGQATEESLDKIEIVKRYLFDRSYPLALPFSLLFDGQNRVAVLYRGGVQVDQLVADVDQLVADAASPAATGTELRDAAVPLAGRWFTEPSPRVPIRAYARWFEERFPDEAASLFEVAIDDASEVLAAPETAGFERLAATHDMSEALHGLASLERRRGNPAAAADRYRALLGIDPGDESARARLLSALFESGDRAELARLVGEWSRAEPGNADLRVRLAEIHVAEGRPAEALEQLRTAVAIEPRNERLRLLYARVLRDNRHSEEAIEQLEVAVKLDPRNPSAHLELGLSLLRHGRRDAGSQRIQEAHGLDPGLLPALADLAWLLATHPSEEMRDGPEALRLARTVMQDSTAADFRTLRTLAAAQAETHDFEAALGTLQEAASLAQAAGSSQAREIIERDADEYRAGRPLPPYVFPPGGRSGRAGPRGDPEGRIRWGVLTRTAPSGPMSSLRGRSPRRPGKGKA